MFVHNCQPSTAPNPSCCSDPTVMCEKCALEALTMNVPHAANIGASGTPKKPTHVPLGIPVMNFRREQKPMEKRQVQAVVQNRRTDGKPTPLGIPVLRF